MKINKNQKIAGNAVEKRIPMRRCRKKPGLCRLQRVDAAEEEKINELNRFVNNIFVFGIKCVIYEWNDGKEWL